MYDDDDDDDDDVGGGGDDDICNGCDDDDDLDDDNGDIVISILTMVGLPQNDVRMQSFDSECLQFYNTSAIILACVMKYLAKAPLSRAHLSHCGREQLPQCNALNGGLTVVDGQQTPDR